MASSTRASFEQGQQQYSVLVKVAAPVADTTNPDMLKNKLAKYFQSKKLSGGGECQVSSLRGGSTFLVEFQTASVQQRVLAKADHEIELANEKLKITLHPYEKSNQQNYGNGTTANIQPILQDQSEKDFLMLDNQPSKHSVQKIFLLASAVIDSALFTKEQVQQIKEYQNIRITPDLDNNKNMVVKGEYKDIVQFHQYLEDLLSGSKHYVDDSPLLREKTVGKNVDEAETQNSIQVPSAHCEYLLNIHSKEIEEMERTFKVKIQRPQLSETMCSVTFRPEGDDSQTARARQHFIDRIHKIATYLSQECITLIGEPIQFRDIFEKAKHGFGKVIIKVEGNQVILWGPRDETVHAKRFLLEEMQQCQERQDARPVKMRVESGEMGEGIDISSALFEILKKTFSKEIEAIEQNFAVSLQERKSKSSPKNVNILLQPKSKDLNLSAHAYKNVINLYQKIATSLIQRTTEIKITGDQRKKMQCICDEMEKKNPNVVFMEKNGVLTLLGLPHHVIAAEKHITSFNDTTRGAHATGSTASWDSAAEIPMEIDGFPSSEQFQRAATGGETEDRCPICLEEIQMKITLKCKHEFCEECITQAMKHKPVCPICNVPYGIIKGTQPEGKMSWSVLPLPLPGYQCGTISINYVFPGGIQKEHHPNPGKKYYGTARTAYLPDNKEGREVLELLSKAFHQKLIFTIGQSRTTGADDTVTWNDIHHKTNMNGGPTSFGYPDPDYLKRVREELKAKGIE